MYRERKPDKYVIVHGHTWHNDDYFCIHCGLREVWKLHNYDTYLCSACGCFFHATEEVIFGKKELLKDMSEAVKLV